MNKEKNHQESLFTVQSKRASDNRNILSLLHDIHVCNHLHHQNALTALTVLLNPLKFFSSRFIYMVHKHKISIHHIKWNVVPPFSQNRMEHTYPYVQKILILHYLLFPFTFNGFKEEKEIFCTTTNNYHWFLRYFFNYK